MRTSIFLAGAAALVLAACGSTTHNTTVVQNAPETVTVTVNGTDSDLVRASQVAMSECGETGRYASLTDISTVDGQRIATFTCVAHMG
jgi:hypothetical protein